MDDREKAEFVIAAPRQFWRLIPIHSWKPPQIGELVLVGDYTKLRIAQVLKIDARSVIKTDMGNFSTKYTHITSTQKVGDRYIQMYSVQAEYDAVVAEMERDRARQLRGKKDYLIGEIERLDFDKYELLIDALLKLIEGGLQDGTIQD